MTETQPGTKTIIPSENPFEITHAQALDFRKEIYAQTQSWARHNETLMTATNTILLGAIAAIWAALYEQKTDLSWGVLFLPFFISLVGFIITMILSTQYVDAISRVVVYERYFGLHQDETKTPYGNLDFTTCSGETNKRWGKSFVPNYLEKPCKYGPTSSCCFALMHLFICLLSGSALVVPLSIFFKEFLTVALIIAGYLSTKHRDKLPLQHYKF